MAFGKIKSALKKAAKKISSAVKSNPKAKAIVPKISRVIDRAKTNAASKVSAVANKVSATAKKALSTVCRKFPRVAKAMEKVAGKAPKAAKALTKKASKITAARTVKPSAKAAKALKKALAAASKQAAKAVTSAVMPCPLAIAGAAALARAAASHASAVRPALASLGQDPLDRLQGEWGLKDHQSGVMYEVFDKSLFHKTWADDHLRLDIAGGEVVAGFGTDEGKAVVGVHAEVYAARFQAEAALAGNKNLGWTGAVEAKVLAAEGFAGYKDGSVGVVVGGTLWSVEGETGLNLAGANVGVSAEIGAKFQLGFSLGKETELHLGPVSLGLGFGKAIE